MKAAPAHSWLDPALFSPLDRQFARLMERLCKGPAPEVALAAALVSRAGGDGNVCLDLREAAATWAESAASIPNAPALADAGAWAARLRQTPIVGAPGEFKPLILDGAGRLYLHRYWEYEVRLADALRTRAAIAAASGPLDPARVREGLNRYFPASPGPDPDWQQVAAVAALRRRLCVISGGPGTGKTHTVGVLLALLLELAGDPPPRVALAAPTGKAAARLQESMQRLRAALPCPDPIRDRLPADAFTVHRLLGATPGSASFRHHAGNPLPLDVLVVDEASMVDLALMAKLFEALPAAARVILLGDKDQLASVEAGAVLGDLCSEQPNGFSAEFIADYARWTGRALAAGPGTGNRPPLADCVVQLEHNRRFAPGSGLLELSRAVNRGDADAALAVLGEGRGVSARDLPDSNHLKAALRQPVLEGYGPAMQARDPAAALQALERFRLLAAVRKGPQGVEQLNRLAAEILAEAGLLNPNGPWFAGRPVMVTENDHVQRLFNGDIGITLPEPGTGELRVHFAAPGGETRSVSPARLPRHETAFALTVHKSQGSEFGRVLLILPDPDQRVLSRELLYTGVTRARDGVELWFKEPVFRAAVTRRVTRASGLRDAVWK